MLHRNLKKITENTKIYFRTVTGCFYCAFAFLYIQLGVIIFIIVDAFHNIPGGLAEQKCPTDLNDTFCSTAWKTTSLLSIFYFFEVQVLAGISGWFRTESRNEVYYTLFLSFLILQ